MIQTAYRLARRIVIGVIGVTVLIFGIIMLVTPGPAIVVIPTGLAILSLEFAWARRWLKRLRRQISERAAGHRGERAEAHRGAVFQEKDRSRRD